MGEETLNGMERTNNACDSWNNDLGGTDAPISVELQCMQQDEAAAVADIVADARVQQPEAKRQ